MNRPLSRHHPLFRHHRPRRRRTLRVIGLPLGLVLGIALAPPPRAEPLQDLGAIEAVARAYAIVELGRGNAVAVTTHRLDPRLRLPACGKLTPFLPDGRKLDGRTMIGVRCAEPVNWRVYVSVDIRDGEDETTSLPARDVEPAGGDGPEVRAVADAGATIAARPTSDRRAAARPVISPGQSVRVEVRGAGFAVHGLGKALGSAIAGQAVRVRMNSGHVVSGIARGPGMVEVAI